MAEKTFAVFQATEANLRVTLVSGEDTKEIAKTIATIAKEELGEPKRQPRNRRISARHEVRKL